MGRRHQTHAILSGNFIGHIVHAAGGGRGDCRAQHDRRDNGSDKGFKDIGAHAGNVTNVIADVISDNARVAGIILGNPGFDLAHQIGPDVGGLGEDSTAHAGEEGNGRGPHAESGNILHRRSIASPNEIEDGHAKQAQARHGQAHHRAAVVGGQQRRTGTVLLCRHRSPHIGRGRRTHT